METKHTARMARMNALCTAYNAARKAYHAEINALGYAPDSDLYKAYMAAREAYDLELDGGYEASV